MCDLDQCGLKGTGLKNDSDLDMVNLSMAANPLIDYKLRGKWPNAANIAPILPGWRPVCPKLLWHKAFNDNE